MAKEVEEDRLFFLVEAVIPAINAGDIGPMALDENNCADGAEANFAPILLSVRMSNLCLEDMVELRHQGIYIDDDNNPAPDNIPRQGETTTVTGNWRREGIIFHCKAVNLQNSSASFRHYYSHYAILRMSLLQLFFIMFPEEYLEEVLIPETNKGLSVPIDLQEYIQWVGFWIYMTCWIGIEILWDWWFTTTPLMDEGAPFRINLIMSCNRFDSIISYLSFYK